jgi:hypothetical protein
VASPVRVGKIGDVINNPVVATANLHRLLYHSHDTTLLGKSYRLRKKRRVWLLALAGARTKLSRTHSERTQRAISRCQFTGD